MELGEKPFLQEIGTLLHVVRASASIGVLRTTVPGMIVLSLPGHDDEVFPACAALHETSEKIGAGESSGSESRFVAEVVVLLHKCNAIPHTIPKLLINNPQFRLVEHSPFGLWALTSNPFVRARSLYEFRAVPNQASNVDFVPKHLTDCIGTPRCIRLALSLSWWWNVLLVELLGDAFQRTTVCGHFKDAPDNRCFGLVDLQPDLAIVCPYIVESETTSSSVLTVENFSFETTVGLLRQFFDVQGVHQAVNGEEYIGLFVLRVDALRNGNDSNPKKFQALIELHRIPEIAEQTAGVVHEQDFKRTRGTGNRRLQSLQSGSVVASAGNRLVSVDVWLQHFQALIFCILTTLSELVINRRRTLTVAGITGVDRTSDYH